MARVWIEGGGSPVFRVSMPGHDVADVGLAAQHLSFDLARVANGTLYAAGHVTEAAVAAAGGVIVSYPNFGYVPTTRVLFRAGYSGGKISNIILDAVVTTPTQIYRQIFSGWTAYAPTDWYYWVFTERV